MSSKNRKYHLKSEKTKSSIEETVLNKKMYLVVDEKHRPMYHEEGYIVMFIQKRKAYKWLEKNNINQQKWRLERLPIIITK